MHRATFLLIPGLLSLSACKDPEYGTLSQDGDTAIPTLGETTTESPTEETTETTETTDDALHGSISGEVTVQLYTTGDDGEREELSWEDSEYTSYPFGTIFVASYTINSNGRVEYAGTDVLTDPSIDPNPYEISAELDEESELYVYAVVDWWPVDGVVGSTEPTGVYPQALDFSDGINHDEIDIEILAPVYGSGGGGTYINISGTNTITGAYEGGSVATMVVSTSGAGPYYTGSSSPEPTETGAVSSHSFSCYANLGEVKVVAAWDSNLNGMYDPDDAWGVHVSEPGVEADPIIIADADLTDIDTEIPFGDAPGVSVVPFVRVSGTVQFEGGSFDDLAEGSEVYVAALKYRPTYELDINDSDQLYDVDKWEWPDLTGQTSMDYSLTVPANSVFYLWAYADEDGDGIINESGEPVASGGEDENGKVATTDEDVTDANLGLGRPPA